MKLIDEPSEQEAQEIAERSCKDSEDDSGSDSDEENIVLKEQSIKILKSYPLREVRHIEACEADRQRHDNGYYRKYEEEEHERRKHNSA